MPDLSKTSVRPMLEEDFVRSRLVPHQDINTDAGNSKKNKKDQANQDSDELRGTFGGGLRRLGNSKRVDKGIRQQKEWFHRLAIQTAAAWPILAGHLLHPFRGKDI
jgi:hypothetical protein